MSKNKKQWKHKHDNVSLPDGDIDRRHSPRPHVQIPSRSIVV